MSKSIDLPKQSDYDIVVEEYHFRSVQGKYQDQTVLDYELIDEAQSLK